jgi:hypothetical protein
MAIVRPKFDLGAGVIYQLPINPISFDDRDDFDVRIQNTVDGSPVRYSSFFDSRPLIMRWEEIPNSAVLNNMVASLKSGVDFPGTRINLYTLHEHGPVDFWRDIRIDGVDTQISSDASSQGTSNLKLNVTLRFTYLRG